MTTISYPLQNADREAVRQLVIAFGEIWPNSHYGPMHIAIADYNLLDHNLEFCRKCVHGMLNDDATQEERDLVKDDDPHDEAELRASLLLLDILALIPEEQRDIHGESVEDFPSVIASGLDMTTFDKISEEWKRRHKNA